MRLLGKLLDKIMKMFRLTEEEEKKLNDLGVKINRVLINSNRKPLSDSKLLHAILDNCLERVEAGEKKEITII